MKRVSRSQVKMAKPQKAVSQVEMQRLPKSVLSRHCQQHQWGQPSFEKLVEVSEGYRDAVSVEVRAKKKDKKVQSGKRRFQVSSYQDGWATIQEAQNAAATVALIYLIPDQQLQHTLPSPYKELYIETKKEEATVLERTQAGEQDWDDFVEQLAKQKFSSEFLQKSNAGNLGRHFLDEQDSSELQEASNERIITRDQHVDVSLRKAMQNFHASKSGRDWSEKRSSLPVLQIWEKVLQVLRRGNAVVVYGDTGCGKTTQVQNGGKLI
ncbi:hypothetical protein BSKO_10927 [Bryopsis sp. KO-2023]|nr:hypothetical protein BSKO_10927 [Bryopsis sp. KO-2023]